MYPIRQIQDVKDGMVTVILPPRFNAKWLNIIIFPVEEKEDKVMADDLQDLLLKSPTLSDEELKEFENVRKWMNQWEIQDF